MLLVLSSPCIVLPAQSIPIYMGLTVLQNVLKLTSRILTTISAHFVVPSLIETVPYASVPHNVMCVIKGMFCILGTVWIMFLKATSIFLV